MLFTDIIVSTELLNIILRDFRRPGNFFLVGIPPATTKGDVTVAASVEHIEREVVTRTQRLAITPSSLVFGGCSNEDFPLHELSTVYSKQLNEIAVLWLYDATISLHCIER